MLGRIGLIVVVVGSVVSTAGARNPGPHALEARTEVTRERAARERVALGEAASRHAARLLGYVRQDGVFMHPRRQERVRTPGPRSPRDGGLPVVLTRAFVEVRTSLAATEVTSWLDRVDLGVEWMRARLAGAPGFFEPEWPLEVRIYRTPEEVVAHGDRAPRRFAFWLEHGVVNAAAFGPGTMPMENVVQHELAHGLIRAAFPSAPGGTTISGWMTDAFAPWIYAASADRPNDPRFRARMERAYDRCCGISGPVRTSSSGSGG